MTTILSLRGRQTLVPLATLLIGLLFTLAALANPLSELLGKSSEPEFLAPEQAFPFSAEWISAQEIRARWDVREHYYLYRDKVRFELIGSNAEIAEVSLPAGKDKDDPYFGKMQVYYGPLEVLVRVDRPSDAPLTLRAHYQGCADAGLCYPPQQIDYPLDTPNAATFAALPVSSPSAPVAAGDPLSQLLANGTLPLILGGFFAAGLLLSFTACLYPMVPILSGLIAGHQNRSPGRAFLLSLIYVEAAAVTYALAGVLAGLSGLAVQANLQSPWVLGGFAALLVLLALSMFGLYSLQLPSGWQTRINELSRHQKGGSFLGVAVMGMLSSLIVGACSGPALIAALAFISTTGDAWLGGLTLFVLANGMGLPLLLIGTALGKWLPRSGPWMNTVKQVFGVAFLIAALLLIERLLPMHVSLALWGALMLGCGVYLGALDRIPRAAAGLVRLRKVGGLLLLIWGVFVLLGAATGGRDLWQPLRGVGAVAVGSAPAPAALSFQPVDDVAGLESALARAQSEGRPAMIDVYADWCVYCVQLERETFPDPAVQAALKDASLLRVDVTRMSDQDKALLNRLKVFLPPAVIFIDDAGRERDRVVGFLAADDFARRAGSALNEAL